MDPIEKNVGILASAPSIEMKKMHQPITRAVSTCANKENEKHNSLGMMLGMMSSQGSFTNDGLQFIVLVGEAGQLKSCSGCGGCSD